MQEPAPSDPKPPSNSYLRYSGFAFQLLGAIGVSGWLGYQLDIYLTLKFPLFLLLFVLLALTGMLYVIYKKLNQD